MTPESRKKDDQQKQEHEKGQGPFEKEKAFGGAPRGYAADEERYAENDYDDEDRIDDEADPDDQ